VPTDTSSTLPVTQRAGGLVEMPALLRSLGVDPRPVLAVAGLDEAALTDIETRVPADAFDRLLEAGVAATRCAHFGLLLGQRWSLSHFGALGELLRHSLTVGEALRTFVVLQHLNSDVGAAFLLETPDTAALGYAVYRGRLRQAVQIYDGAMAIACNLLRELCPGHWTPQEILLSRAEPAEAAPYRQVYRARIRFDQTYSAVRFSSRWLAQPLPGADAARHHSLMAELGAADSRTLIPRLHRALRLLLLEGDCSGDALAQILAMHRRTLNRRLREQGTTFRQLLDEVRLEVARQLLGQTRTPVEEIATALCYADISAFMHAFRRWTGTTPVQFRREHRSR
jgi:AraC-like DNA-binding protein